MNRLILLGNGFDLAHKMKTSYYDFILDYLQKSFKEAITNNEYKDDLIEIERDLEFGLPEIEQVGSVKQLLIFEINKDGNYVNQTTERKKPKSFKLKIKSKFIKRILNDCCDYNWVNIENEYYIALKRILNDTPLENSKQPRIDSLNQSMNFLIRQLNTYFQLQASQNLIREYRSILQQEFIPEDFVKRPSIPIDGKYPIETLILNFNYTNTVENYTDSLKTSIKVNYIHGRFNDESNPIIFGFGDEMDDDYKRIESEKEKGFLRYIKSFGYFKTSNYHNLIRFIDSDKFQVFICGHSCGLSDRTMLNMIFEHENCVSIKIFYHKTELHFRDLTEEISRHFRDKSSMRKKIVPFEKSSEMPQAKN